MKLLFTGPLLDFSGFAHASRNFARALDQSPDIDVVARPLQYDMLDAGEKFVPPAWLQEMLEKDLMGVDMCIQMTTCNIEAQPVPGVCNALYTFLETDRLPVAWAQKANEFDFIIVPCKENAMAFMNCGIQKPVLVCAPPCDANDYHKDPAPFKIEQAGNRTIFYNICQLSTKKGIDLLLRAYYAAFADIPDDTLLVLKTYINMQNRQQDLAMVKQYISTIRDKCRIPVQKFPPVLPLVYIMSDDEINGLHTTGHAYVCSSRGEGWGIPVFDALAFGKTVISHQGGGLAEFVRPDNALVYGGTSSLYFDMPHPDPALFTGVERCYEPSVAEMSMIMRRFHDLRRGATDGTLDEGGQAEWEAVLQRRANARVISQNFDYREAWKKIVPQLSAALDSWKETGVAKFEIPEEKDEPAATL
jgi:glycosyltransferase involved in cell wall biosynthesis